MNDRLIAIGTNIVLIKKLAIQDGRHDLANDELFLESAARWSYRRYGFGKACYGEYLDFIEHNKNYRLGSINLAEWNKLRMEIFRRDGFRCTYCGVVGGKLECDHVVPVSKGGTNELSNLTTSCRSCNRSKKDKLLSEWIN